MIKSTRASSAILLTCLLTFAPSLALQPLDGPTAPETEWRFTIPLEDGEFQLGVLVGELAELVGFDGEAVKKQTDHLVPIRTPVGSTTVRLLSSLTDGIVRVELGGDEIVVSVDRVRLRQQRTEFNAGVRRMIESFFPEAAALARGSFGVVVHTAGGEPAPLTEQNAPAHAVVLIHGLDDAGRLWRQATPQLLNAGYTVCEITYPDDQAIAESSSFVASLFAEMKQAGVARVSIVAHSMGSLISRDILTNPKYMAGTVGGTERYPRVDRLIMLGPPNHGSKMALFRVASEARDQTVRALSGDGLLVGGFFDGAGEAQDDLLPGSAFLTELNARSLPADLPVTIIAGSASPFTADELSSMARRLDAMGKSKLGQVYEGSDLERSAGDLIDGLGDGCVSLESTRLKGVADYVVVRANHLGMIQNMFGRGDRIPPAVPIILDRLARDRALGP